MRSLEAFAILLASVNRRCALDRSRGKHTQMNRQIQTSAQLTEATHAEAGASKMDELAQSSFTAEEIAALFWRRRLVPKRWQRSHAARAKLRVPQVAGHDGQANSVSGVQLDQSL
jgi:hypothetical protein